MGPALQQLRHHSVAWSRRVTGVVGELALSVLAAAAVIVLGTWLFVTVPNRRRVVSSVRSSSAGSSLRFVPETEERHRLSLART